MGLHADRGQLLTDQFGRVEKLFQTSLDAHLLSLAQLVALVGGADALFVAGLDRSIGAPPAGQLVRAQSRGNTA